MAAKPSREREKKEESAPVKTVVDSINPVVLETLEAPEAYTPPSLTPWPADDDDKFMTPFPSYVNDFVYSMKGKESPVLFNIFAALWTLSAMSTRKSYFRWAVGALWPNIYVLFVADPSHCHKGAAPGRSEKLLKKLAGEFKNDKIMMAEKRFNFLNSNTSPEFMYDMLEPREEYFILPGSEVHKEMFGSSLTIWAAELTTMINNKKYASGMIENMTAWYDCPDDDISGTRTSGKRSVKNLFITLIGALTPQHLKQSLPPEAYSTGFMSRCILLYQHRPTVFWPEPVDFDGTPTQKNLLNSLHWLAYNIRGEYDFTPEAREFYHRWYIEYQGRVLKKESQIVYYARARFTQTVIRVACLLRMSEYRPGKDVTLVHLKHAITLLEHIFTLQEPLTAEVDISPESVSYIRVRDIIKRDVQIQRQNLLRRMSAKGILVTQVNASLMQLKQEGHITYILNGRSRDASAEPSSCTREIYQWVGEPLHGDEI